MTVSTAAAPPVPAGAGSRPPVIVVSRRLTSDAPRRRPAPPCEDDGGDVARLVRSAVAVGDRWVALPEEGVTPGAALAVSAPAQVRSPATGRRATALFGEACRSLLWPALHGLPASVPADDQLRVWDEGFRPVTAAFARAVAEEWHRLPAPVLLQDFELFGCGSVLRRMLPDARIALACHTPFAGASALRTLPHLIVLDTLHGLLGCDVVAFRSYRDRRGFVEACAVHLGARVQGDLLRWAGRRVRLSVLPVGPAADDAAPAPPEEPRFARAPIPAGERVVAWAGPADPVSNPQGALRLFEGLLARDPSLEGRVRLLMAVWPWSDRDPAADGAVGAVLDAAAAVNARFASHHWVPVALEVVRRRDRRLASLERADVAVDASLGGSTPAAVEFAVRSGARLPALLLSTAGGAYEQFGDVAVPFDPHAADAGASALAEALAVPVGQRLRSLETARARLADWAPAAWLQGQVRAVGPA